MIPAFEGCLHESGLNQPRLIWQLQRLQPPPKQVPVLGHLMSQIILTLRYGWAGVHLDVAFGVIHMPLLLDSRLVLALKIPFLNLQGVEYQG